MQKKDKKVKKIMMKKVSHMPLYHGIYRLKENFLERFINKVF